MGFNPKDDDIIVCVWDRTLEDSNINSNWVFAIPPTATSLSLHKKIRFNLGSFPSCLACVSSISHFRKGERGESKSLEMAHTQEFKSLISVILIPFSGLLLLLSKDLFLRALLVILREKRSFSSGGGPFEIPLPLSISLKSLKLWNAFSPLTDKKERIDWPCLSFPTNIFPMDGKFEIDLHCTLRNDHAQIFKDRRSLCSGSILFISTLDGYGNAPWW